MINFIYRFISLFYRLPNEIQPFVLWEKCYGKDLPLNLKSRLKLYNRMNAPKIYKFLNLFYYKVYPNNDMGRSIFVSGTYEPNTLTILTKILKNGDSFIDVGANSGIFSIVAAKLVGDNGRVYSFEPSSREYLKLQENVLINALEKIIISEKLGVSSRNEKAVLNIATDCHNGQNTICNEFAYENVESGRTETIDCVSLDEYVKANNINNIKLIKVDVEGAEILVLNGANNLISSQRPIIIFEVVKEAYRKNNIQIINLKNFFIEHRYITYSIDSITAKLLYEDIMIIQDGNVLAVPIEKNDIFNI
jgi:FkbM family methyltransferase